MPDSIRDGSGDGHQAEVDSELRLHTASVSETPLTYHSHQRNSSYFVHSSYTTTGTNQRVFSIKNTSSTELVRVDTILLPTNTTCRYILEKVTAGTGAGTALAPVNMNLSSALTPDIAVYGGAEVTGITATTHFSHANVLANTTFTVNMGGALILGLNDELTIKVAETGVYTGVTMFFYTRPEGL